ncbi:MAG: hypothetical protein IJP46_08660 [Prevotella sp.]|nr:hypothetical protein [Prevotella sp.]
MTTKKNMVKSMFMSILTAGVFAFGFTACSENDDVLGTGSKKGSTAEADAKTPALEPIGLSYQMFVTPEDVQILDADTTMISVNKALADKLGIESFVNHPMGIWQKMEDLPYLRRAVSQELQGDRYILKVIPATIAEVTNGRQFKLDTHAYVNPNAGTTRSGGDGSFSDKYVDEEGTLHPVAIMKHHNAHYGDEVVTRGNGDGWETYSAEEMVERYGQAETSTTRGFTSGNLIDYKKRGTILDVKTKLSKEFKQQWGGSDESKDSLNINVDIPIEFQLNYTFILDAGREYVVVPVLHEFEASVDGRFYFAPQVTIGFSKSLELPKDKRKIKIYEFDAVTFVFTIGYVPFSINLKPSIDLTLKAKVEGSVYTGVKYEYEKVFKAGVRYQEGCGWDAINNSKVKKNKISFITPRAEFNAEAGAGLYFGVAVMVDNVVGPTLAVGPEITAQAGLAIKPFEEDPIDFSASLKVGLYGRVGAKLSVFGWDIAEWNTKFNIVPEKVLWKYPNTSGDDPEKYNETSSLLEGMTEETIFKAAYERFAADMEMQSYMAQDKAAVDNALRVAYNKFKNEMFRVPSTTSDSDMAKLVQMTKDELKKSSGSTIDQKQLQQLRAQAIKIFKQRYGRSPKMDPQTRQFVPEDEAIIQQIIQELL